MNILKIEVEKVSKSVVNGVFRRIGGRSLMTSIVHVHDIVVSFCSKHSGKNYSYLELLSLKAVPK